MAVQPGLSPALQATVEHDLVFDALVHPWQLPRIRELARRYPDLRIVIDHACKPEIAQGSWAPGEREMQFIADETMALCKLSGCRHRREPRRPRRWSRGCGTRSKASVPRACSGAVIGRCWNWPVATSPGGIYRTGFAPRSLPASMKQSSAATLASCID